MGKTRKVRVYKKGGMPKFQDAGGTGINLSKRDQRRLKKGKPVNMLKYPTKYNQPHNTDVYNVSEIHTTDGTDGFDQSFTNQGVFVNRFPDGTSNTQYSGVKDGQDYYYNTDNDYATYGDQRIDPKINLNEAIANLAGYQQKRGGEPCFDCGGNIFQQGGPQEQMMQQPGQEQMMQGQPPQQQPQQPQMNPEELMQQIAQALQQGATPEEIVQGLVQEMGMPQDQAVQMVTQVIETLKSQQQQQQQPQMEQGPPMEQPPMEHGGNVFKEHPTDENNFQLRKDHISKILKSNVDDFEYDDMIKQADELMEMSYPQFKLGGEKWMQKAAKSMKKRGTIGSFKEHCGGKVTLDCIKKGLRSRNPKIRKKAGFAKASWKMAGKMQMGGLSKFQVAGQPSWKVPLPPQIYQTVTPEDNLYGNIDDDQLSIIAQYAKDKGVDVEDVQYTPQRENIKKRLFRPNQMNIDYSLNVKGQGLDDVKAQAHKDFGHMNKDMFDDWDDDSYKKYAEQAGLDYTPSEQGQMTALRNKKQERQNRKDSGVGAFERNFGRKMDGLDIANAATATTGAIAGWAQNDEQNRQRMNTAFASIPGGAGNPIDVDHQGKSGDRGDYMDEGQFRPDELGPDAYSMKNDASYFAAQKGGNIGDVTYMTDEELKKFIEGGGQVEILDY